MPDERLTADEMVKIRVTPDEIHFRELHQDALCATLMEARAVVEVKMLISDELLKHAVIDVKEQSKTALRQRVMERIYGQVRADAREVERQVMKLAHTLPGRHVQDMTNILKLLELLKAAGKD